MRVTESKPNTCYLTAGGYLVVLKVEEYLLRTTKELSPGFTKNGRSVNELSHPYGWRFQEDGVMIGLAQEWNEKLHIIAELPFGIPELPKGYGWKGGYPVLRKPEPGEEYLSPHCDRGGHEFCYKHGYSIATGVSGETTGFGRRRLIVEAHPSPPKTEDKYAKYATFPVEVKTEVLMDSVEDTKFHKDNNITTVVFPAVEDCEEIKMAEGKKKEFPNPFEMYHVGFDEYMPSRLDVDPPARQSKLSYFITEPLANTYKFFKPSFRYVLLYSTIAAIVYSAANFETVVGLIKSCLPKVSIEWREK